MFLCLYKGVETKSAAPYSPVVVLLTPPENNQPTCTLPVVVVLVLVLVLVAR